MTGSAGSVHIRCVRVVFSSSGPLFETEEEEEEEKEGGDDVPPSRPPESSGVALLHSKLSASDTNR